MTTLGTATMRDVRKMMKAEAHDHAPPTFSAVVSHDTAIDITRAGKAAGREVLSIRQSCKRAGVSRRTIYNWISTGKLEYVRTAGGAVRIFEDTLFRTP